MKTKTVRLYGKKDTGANVEFVLLKQLDGDIWESIVRPGNKLKPGSKVIFGDGLLKAEILDVLEIDYYQGFHIGRPADKFISLK